MHADRSIRCRLANADARVAIEFSAQDARTLAAGCRRAFVRYCDEQRAAWEAGPQRMSRVPWQEGVAFELQVRPVDQCQERTGWFAPVRDRLPVRVVVSADRLKRRPVDDWSVIWEWVQDSRQADRALAAFVTTVALDVDGE